MATTWRVLLWILVVIAPGGLLLLPILAADAMRRRAAAPAISKPASILPQRQACPELAPAHAT